MPAKSASFSLVEACALTHRGKVREENQDAFVLGAQAQPPTAETVVREAELPAEGGLAAVIDGMGGLGGGDIAAGWLARRWATRPTDKVRMLRGALIDDHRALLMEARFSPTPLMGAVATGALLRNSRIKLFHVGDTRAYFIGRDRATLLTRDHVNNRGVLTQSFGGGELPGLASQMEPQILDLAWPAEQLLLLMSDGAWRHLPPAAITTIYAARPKLRDFVLTLAALVLEGPADDNFTFVALRPLGR